MEHKISSSFTEFYKAYLFVSLFVLLLIVGNFIFNFAPISFPFSFLPFGLIILIHALTAIDVWRMKEVELTEAGFLITGRFFFKQKTTFVPFESVERVKNKYWWLGYSKRITIKFNENTEFGEEASFLSKSFTRMGQVKMVEELNQLIWDKKTDDAIKILPKF